MAQRRRRVASERGVRSQQLPWSRRSGLRRGIVDAARGDQLLLHQVQCLLDSAVSKLRKRDRNSAQEGGAVAAVGTAAVVVDSSDFTSNQATSASLPTTSSPGGAILAVSTSLSVQSSTFTANSASQVMHPRALPACNRSMIVCRVEQSTLRTQPMPHAARSLTRRCLEMSR